MNVSANMFLFHVSPKIIPAQTSFTMFNTVQRLYIMKKAALWRHFGVGAEQLKMQQMQTGEAVASYKRHKRGSDANSGASGNHYCLCAVPSAFPGTYQTQNGAQGLMIMS